MYSLTVRDHIMIAHSFNSPAFGPAQKLHGATYIVDAEFQTDDLDDNHLVIDIAIAHELLKEVLGGLNYQNLDELPEFKGKLTTTEYMARYIFDSFKEHPSLKGFSGGLKITLHESHVAWAAYSGRLG